MVQPTVGAIQISEGTCCAKEHLLTSSASKLGSTSPCRCLKSCEKTLGCRSFSYSALLSRCELCSTECTQGNASRKRLTHSTYIPVQRGRGSTEPVIQALPARGCTNARKSPPVGNLSASVERVLELTRNFPPLFVSTARFHVPFTRRIATFLGTKVRSEAARRQWRLSSLPIDGAPEAPDAVARGGCSGPREE